jgi:hypothetical protein
MLAGTSRGAAVFSLPTTTIPYALLVLSQVVDSGRHLQGRGCFFAVFSAAAGRLRVLGILANPSYARIRRDYRGSGAAAGASIVSARTGTLTERHHQHSPQILGK